MKSILNVPPSFTYPGMKCREGKDGQIDLVVLFLTNNTGTIIYSESKHGADFVGNFGRDFVEKDFFPFNGSIEISNN